MAVCSKCKKSLNVLTRYENKGKYYCIECYNKILKKEKKQKRKIKDEKDAKSSILRAYKYDKIGHVRHLIKQWKPRGCKNHEDYKNSLKNYLDKELSPDEIYIAKETGLDSSRLDLAIGIKKPYKDIAIEIKFNLKKSPEFDRLKGQIHTYVVSKFQYIIIILTGTTEPKYKTELKKYNKEIEKHYATALSSSVSSAFSSIVIIEK
jgi:hypothetical protein